MASHHRPADAVTIAIGADHDYAMQLAVALRSLADHGGDGIPTVFVLHDGFDDDLRRRVHESCGPDLALEWITVDHATIADLKTGARLPHSSAYRVLVPRLLPSALARVVYVDADILVRRPLTDLWSTDLASSPFGAVRDAYIPSIAADVPWRRLGLDPRTPYFNAGVLLMDLHAWRDTRVSERALDLLRVETFPNSEQTALNAVAGGWWHALDPVWNVQSHFLAADASRAWGHVDTETLTSAIADPGIVHFCHGEFARPWQAGSSHPYRDEWLATLDRTAWAGTRPRRHWGAGALRRLRRVGRGLAGGSS